VNIISDGPVDRRETSSMLMSACPITAKFNVALMCHYVLD